MTEPSAGAGIHLGGLSSYPTHTTVDRFEVEVSNLTATAAYQVIVSSDSAGLGIGACGTASQTETVTGVAAQTLTFFLYVCTEDSGTLTAELRPDRRQRPAEAAVTQRLSVVAIPDEALADARGGAGSGAQRGAGGHARDRVGDPLRHRHEHVVPGEVEPAQRRRARLDRLRDPAVDGRCGQRQAGLQRSHHHRRPDHL